MRCKKAEETVNNRYEEELTGGVDLCSRIDQCAQ